MTKQRRMYGTWSSSISSSMVSAQIRLNDVQWQGETLVWHESRGPLGVLVAQTGNDAPRDLTVGVNVRAHVNYGGGDFALAADHVVFAGPGGRLYRQSLMRGMPQPLTPAFGQAAAPVVSPDGQWVVYVHTAEKVDGLGIVDIQGRQWPRKLAFGHDFVMQPCWHPDGRQIAYIAWNHPNMPWDGTELCLVKLNADMSVHSEVVLAGDENTAVAQPTFSPDGRSLAYLSDETGFSQLYVLNLSAGHRQQITTELAEHAIPAWQQGVRRFVWSPNGRSIYYLRTLAGRTELMRVDVDSGVHNRLDAAADYTHLEQIAINSEGVLALLGSSSVTPKRVITLRGEIAVRIHKRSASEQIPLEALSPAQPITWRGHDGEKVHGLFYAPASPDYESSGLPPLIVAVHGGPTSQRVLRYEAEIQFYTSRGYAVLDVNHRGSTGYGREYMLKLRGQWGYYDVEDAVSGVQYLAEQRLIDEKRVAIMGGSAGGFTVLQSLVDKPGFYRAGICLYGVSDQFMLVQETHKFEERYSDSLLGPLPEAAETYRARSPLLHAHAIVDPVIVFQGEDDVVVPRSQSDLIVESLRSRRIPYEYHIYAGEGHGFNKPETIDHYLNAVIAFLTKHMIYR